MTTIQQDYEKDLTTKYLIKMGETAIDWYLRYLQQYEKDGTDVPAIVVQDTLNLASKIRHYTEGDARALFLQQIEEGLSYYISLAGYHVNEEEGPNGYPVYTVYNINEIQPNPETVHYHMAMHIVAMKTHVYMRLLSLDTPLISEDVLNYASRIQADAEASSEDFAREIDAQEIIEATIPMAALMGYNVVQHGTLPYTTYTLEKIDA